MADQDSPEPSGREAAPRPRIKSHIFNVLSLPTLNATRAVGCTSTLLTRPECPLRDLSNAQSEVRNNDSVESSDVVTRCEGVGKCSDVMDPVFQPVPWIQVQYDELTSVL